jgi:hypothetical protein
MALLQVVHWFNPLMWFAFGRMRADRELACDRLVISTMGPDEPPEYGRTIVSLLESFSQAHYLPSVAGILEDTCQMERRIKMIADYKKTPRPRWAGAMLLLAVLACLVLTNAYVAKADFTFGEPVNLGPTINTVYDEIGQSISADGLTLYFGESMTNPGLNGYGGPDLWVTTRGTIDDEWDPPTNLGPTVNTSYADVNPSISTDGLSLYFASNRAEGYGSWDLWMTRRDTTDTPWTKSVNLGPSVNSSANEGMPSLSANGSTLYFCSDRPGGSGGYDLWQVTILPVVDFNSDGNIDTDDLLILIGFWGQNEPLCDISPAPVGDGIVDIKDLEVFMSYWEKENMTEAPEEEQ